MEKIAIENDVTDLNKKIVVDFPPITIGWGKESGERFYKFKHRITASVIFKDTNKYLCLLRGEVVRDRKNEYITVNPFLYFKNEQESDEFEKIISEENIKKGLDEKRKAHEKAMEEKKKVDELFK